MFFLKKNFDNLTFIVTGFMSVMFVFYTVSPCLILTFDCFIGFDNLVAVFGCSIVCSSMSTILRFSITFNSLGIFLSFF